MNDTAASERIARRLIEVFALAVCVTAITAVMVRVLGQWSPWVAGFKSWFVIAFHNSLFLSLLGLALFVYNRWPQRRAANIFGGVVVGIVGAASLLALVRELFPIPFEFEAWIAVAALPRAAVLPGRMSVHTAATFCCAAGALVCLLGVRSGGHWRRQVAFLLAVAAFGSGLFAALGFLVGTPLRAEFQFSAMMWMTATLLALLGAGLMLAAYPDNWLLQGLTGRAADEDAHSRRLRRALALTLLFLTGGVIMTGFYFLRKEQANLRARVEQELAAVANLKVEQVADWRNDRLREANLMFHTPYAARRALDALAAPDSQPTREMFTGWLGPFLAMGPYAEAVVLDSKLNVGLVHPPHRNGRLFETERGAARDALRTRQVVVTDLHRSSNSDDAVYLSLMVPIVVRKEGDRESVPAAGLPPSPRDRTAAVLVLRMNARETLFPLLNKWPAASHSAEALLVRRDRKDCAYLSDLRHATNAALQLRLPMTRTNSPAVQAAAGQQSVCRGLDYRNVPVVAVTRQIPKSPWALVAKMDEAEIYAPVRARGRTLSLFLGTLLVAVTLSLNLLWRRRDVELLRRQVAAEHERFALAQRLAHVLKQANDIITMTDEQWRIVEANDRALEAYGYTLAELKQMRAADLRAAETRPEFEAFENLLNAQGQAVAETVHRRKDGSTFPVEVSARRVEIDGTIRHLAVIRDITERKRAEEALRQSEEKYRLLFDSAVEGVAVADRETKMVLYANPAYCGMYGYTNEELLRLRVEDLHPAEALPQALAEFDAQTRGEPGILAPIPCRRKDGSVFFAEIRAKPAVIAGRPTLVGFFTDVTERKRAEEALRDSEERFRLLAESSLAGIYLFQNHRFVYVNPALAATFGYQPDEIIGQLGPSQLTHPEDRPLVSDNIRRRMENGVRQVHYEFRGLRKDGSTIRVEALGARIEYHGQPAILGTLLDITEKKQLEAQFLRAQRLEGIGALAGGIAHDLNNILTPILMSTSLLQETVSDPESRSMVATLSACAQRGADIIRQLLTFARGKPSARVPVPVRHLLQDMGKLIRETFPRNIQPVVTVPRDLWLVLGDATQIHQALMNLCVNARDAMPEGGTLTVSASNLVLDETAAATIPNARPGHYVCMSVSDTGAGIPPEYLDRIFDPFFTTKALGKGTGLGLATVLGIARGHDGFVQVHTRLGEGTTLEIYLRATPEAQAAAAPEPEASPPRGQGELVLVVDDEAAVRNVVQRTLETHGYRVLTATEGGDALKQFAGREGDIKAVLTDMMMPGMEGPALVGALRQAAPGLPIIGMTGLAQRSGVKGVETLDLPVLLVKPFGAAKLLSAMHEALRRPSEAGAATTNGHGRCFPNSHAVGQTTSA